MLRLEDLHVGYGPIAAVRGLDLVVEEGELVALVGANGAGKTSTLLAAAGVLKPTRGRIRFAGKDITRLPPERVVALGIATVPETRDVFPDLTVRENLRLGAYVRRGDRAGYARDLEAQCSLFPVLGERLDQAAGFLSGGEQQQLAIARALMSRPRLLMLDEPSLGLAPALVDRVFALVAGLRREGRTILLVEQNVRQTLAIADRAYLLELGRVKASGTPAELAARVDLASAYLGGGPVSPVQAAAP
ncbi:MAG: ABC transporter ATP-binding protein [Gammaproteobacteria bacterium]|nr:ABC transporter ATP-binding protein [Gammaproteobacteria bacterium]